MNILIPLLGFAVWWIIGYQGFKFWWTSENDFTTDERPVAWGVGLLGPCIWILGAFVHNTAKPRIIKKKREP